MRNSKGAGKAKEQPTEKLVNFFMCRLFGCFLFDSIFWQLCEILFKLRFRNITINPKPQIVTDYVIKGFEFKTHKSNFILLAASIFFESITFA